MANNDDIMIEAMQAVVDQLITNYPDWRADHLTIVDLATVQLAQAINRDKPLSEQHSAYKILRRGVRWYVQQCHATCDVLKAVHTGNFHPTRHRKYLPRVRPRKH